MNKERIVAVYIGLYIRHDSLLPDIHEARLPLKKLCKELLHWISRKSNKLFIR
jgi:hypothetical protein